LQGSLGEESEVVGEESVGMEGGFEIEFEK
jgi:hypothetical protein